MSININDLTHEEKYFLLDLSYIDLDHLIDYEVRNVSIEKALENALLVRRITPKQTEQINELIDRYAALREKGTQLEQVNIIGYQNHNPVGNTTHDTKSGFVGYVLEDPNGNRGFLFRGSELGLDQKPMVDMGDNLGSAFTGTSVQLTQALKFFDDYKVEGKTNSLYGHSKGNNLQTKVFLENLDLDIYAYGVNGQPIYYYDLTNEQKAALKGDRYTFIIHELDIVNMLGYVDYIDIVVKIKDYKKLINPFYPHSTGSVEFDETGDFVSTKDPNVLGRQGINIAVTTVKSIEELTIGRFRNFSEDPFGIKALQNVGKNLYNLSIDTVHVILTFVYEKASSMVSYVKDKLVEYAEKLGKWTTEKIESFKGWLNKLVDDATTFFEKVKEVARNAYKETLQQIEKAREKWNRLKEQTASKVSQFIDNLKTNISNKKDEFVEKTKSFHSKITNLQGKFRKQAIKTISSILMGASKGSSKGPKIGVNLGRLEGLQRSVQRSGDNVSQLVRRIVSTTTTIIGNVRRRYHEPYVQSQIHQLEKMIEQIRREEKKVADHFQQTSKGLRMSVEKYRQVESQITKNTRRVKN